MPAANGRTASLGRLKKRSEFLAVAAANRRWSTPGLVLQARRREDGSAGLGVASVRLGFTATKKIGNAVARNRARRRLKAAVAELLRGELSREDAPAAVDLVVIARRETIKRPYPDLKNDLSAALRRLGVLR